VEKAGNNKNLQQLEKKIEIKEELDLLSVDVTKDYIDVPVDKLWKSLKIQIQIQVYL
jgi:hypothetical protein